MSVAQNNNMSTNTKVAAATATPSTIIVMITNPVQTKMTSKVTPLSSSPRTTQYITAHPPPLLTTEVRSSRTTIESVRLPSSSPASSGHFSSHHASSSPSFPFPSSSPRKPASSTAVSLLNVKSHDGKQTQTPQQSKHKGNPRHPPPHSFHANDLRRSYASSLPRVPLAAAATAQLSPARRQQLASAGLSPKAPLELLCSIAVVGGDGTSVESGDGNKERGGGGEQKGTTVVEPSAGWLSQSKKEDLHDHADEEGHAVDSITSRCDARGGVLSKYIPEEFSISGKTPNSRRRGEGEEQMMTAMTTAREGANKNNNTLNSAKGAAAVAVSPQNPAMRDRQRQRHRGLFISGRIKGGRGRKAMLRARDISCFSSPLSCEGGAEVDSHQSHDVANGSGSAFVSSSDSTFFSPTFSALPTGAMNSSSSSSARHRVAGGASSSSSPASLPLGTAQHDTPSHPTFSPPSSFSSPLSSTSAPSSLLRTFDKITGQLMHVSSCTYESAKALARDQYRVDRADPACLAEAAKNVLALPLREQMQLAERRFYRLARERSQRRYGVLGGGAFLWGEEDDGEGVDGDGEDIMMSSGSAWTTRGGGGQEDTPSTRVQVGGGEEEGERRGGKGSKLVVVQLSANSALSLHQGSQSTVVPSPPPNPKARSDAGGSASALSRSSRRRSDENKSTDIGNSSTTTTTKTHNRTKSNNSSNKSSGVANVNVGSGSSSSSSGYSIFPPTSTLPPTSRFVHQRSLFEAHTALGEIAMHLGKPTASVGANKMHRAAVDQFLLERAQAEADRYLTILTSNLLPENLPPVELLHLRLDAIRHRSIPIGKRPDGMATLVGEPSSSSPTVAEGSRGRSNGNARAGGVPGVGEEHQRNYSIGHRSRRSHQTEENSGRQQQQPPSAAVVAQHYSSQPSVQAMTTCSFAPRLSSSTLLSNTLQ